MRCKKCSGVLEKEQRQEGCCQYCQLKGKIDQEIENMQKLFEESGDPDISRQLEELELMASALKKKRDEEDKVKEEEDDMKPDVLGFGDGEFVVSNEQIEHVNKEELEEEDKKPDLGLVKEEEDINDEEYLKSLPSGWTAKNVKVGFGSIIKHFLDPFGRRFVSRIDAIRTLSKLGDHREDVYTLRSGLQVDGWITHPFLPDGWFAKPVGKTALGSNSLRFLTDKNEWFIGIRKAVKLLNNSEEYTSLDLDNLHAFFGMYSSFKREADETWMDGEEYLPEGWRYKISHGSNGDYARLLSPNGDLFSSKSKALAYMVKNKYDEAAIKKMISALVYDGWVESSFLPPEWRYRKCKSGRNEYNFLSPEGEMFPSRKTLVAFMRSNDKYSEEDINSLDALKVEIRAKWVQSQHDWIEDDKTIPTGWKIRYFESARKNKVSRKRCYILSPSGALFQTRLKSLQFMIQNCHPEDQISYMRSQLEREGWCCHPMLPENWRIKKKLNGKGFLFFTVEGLILSLKGALSHIEQSSAKYSAEDSDGLVFVAKGFSEHLTKQNYEWLESGTVPAGWKVRKVSISGSFEREYFLTPQGAQIGGRVKTIKYLLKEGMSLTHPDVKILRSGLSIVGWQEDTDIVPPGWMKKQVVKSSTRTNKYKYITPDYKEFHSLTKVYHFMRANSFPTDVLNKVKPHLDVKSMLSNRRMFKKGKMDKSYKWQKAHYLPPGWKVAEKKLRYGQKKQLFISPTGLMLNKAVLAFQLVVEEGVDNTYLGQMYEQLSKEGWEEDSSLPAGWRLNVDRNQFPDTFIDEDDMEVLFLTDKAQILTKAKALKLLSSSEAFSGDQVDNFLSLVDNMDNGYERSWKEDPTLPEGWKIKEVDLSFKKEYHVMTPDQEEFESILTAFIYMMSNQDVFEEGDIFKMKAKLEIEGFEENNKLPAGWRIIRNRGENLFELLSREGALYQTLTAAQEFMETSKDYDDKHVLDLEELCLAEVEVYLNNRVITNPGFGKLALATASGDSSPVTSSGKKRKKGSGYHGGRKRKYAN